MKPLYTSGACAQKRVHADRACGCDDDHRHPHDGRDVTGERYVFRSRLRFAWMMLVQDLRDMQANAVCEGCFYTIVFVANENRYCFRQGTKSYAPPGAVRTERLLSRYAGFLLAVGKRSPVSAVFSSESSMPR